MPNLLGVTNPAPNYDNTNNSRPVNGMQRPENTQIQNVPDPGRVVRPDGRTEQQGADNPLAPGYLRYDSNLQVFLQRLREMPELTAELSKMVTMLRAVVSTPGLTEGVAGELEAFLRMFQMDGEQFKAFFLSQVENGSRFRGPLFAVLRQAYQKSGSESVQEAILNFAKRYSDFSSTGHIGRHMLQLLEQMQSRIPQSWRGQLSELIGALENGLQAGDRSGNLDLLRGSILPYLGSYISRYHDFGEVRTLLGMLILDTARYENGSEEGLMMAFRQLGSYGGGLSAFAKLDDAAVWKLLQSGFSGTDFADQLVEMASRALDGRYGTDVREAFQEILRALIVNESVFLPLAHMMIPVEYNGKKMYSEFWVDPDAKKKGQDGKDAERIQFLFKMDIESLGFLEMTLAVQKDQAELAVYGPKTLLGNSAIIAEDLKEILELHGLKGKSVRVLEEKRPLTLTEVFPSLFEGRYSVNVKA